MIARRLLERWSRGRVVRRRLPAEFGRSPIFVTGDAALKYLGLDLRKSSDELFRVAQACIKDGSTVWDVGANVGVFSFAAAHRTGDRGQVLAIEADPVLASLIQRTALLPAYRADVKVLCAAISDRQSISRFLIANRGRASNGLEQTGHRSMAGGTRYVQYVPTFTADNLLDHFPAPDVVKIDIEGSEILLLKGASRLLRDVRPAIFVEVGAQQREEATRILTTNEYRLFDGTCANFTPVESCTFNTLAIPAESVSRLPRKPSASFVESA